MADQIVDRWKPGGPSDLDRVVATLERDGEDALVSARKIRQPIVTNDDIQNAFDGITYEKGAARDRRCSSAGSAPEPFRKGVHDYLDAHAFGERDGRDFLGRSTPATGADVAHGVLDVPRSAGRAVRRGRAGLRGRPARLALRQSRYLPLGSSGEAPPPGRFPFARRRAGGDARGCTLLADAEGDARPGGACPEWVLPTPAAPATTARSTGALLRRLVPAADKELTVSERVSVIRAQRAHGAGDLPVFDALALVPRMPRRPSRQVVQSTVRLASDLREHLIPGPAAQLRAVLRRCSGKTPAPSAGPRSRGRTMTPGFCAPSWCASLRSRLETAAHRGGRRLALKWLEDGSAVSADMVGEVLEVAGRYGDRALFDRFLAAAKKSPQRRDRARLYYALGASRIRSCSRRRSRHPAPALDYRETDSTLFAGLGTNLGRATLWDFTKANFDAIVARMPRETTGGIAYVAERFCDAAIEKDAKSFLSGRVEKLPGGPRNLAQALEGVQLCIASRTAQEPSVGEFWKYRAPLTPTQ